MCRALVQGEEATPRTRMESWFCLPLTHCVTLGKVLRAPSGPLVQFYNQYLVQGRYSVTLGIFKE